VEAVGEEKEVKEEQEGEEGVEEGVEKGERLRENTDCMVLLEYCSCCRTGLIIIGLPCSLSFVIEVIFFLFLPRVSFLERRT
jgi:hypothetical protein